MFDTTTTWQIPHNVNVDFTFFFSFKSDKQCLGSSESLQCASRTISLFEVVGSCSIKVRAAG